MKVRSGFVSNSSSSSFVVYGFIIDIDTAIDCGILVRGDLLKEELEKILKEKFICSEKIMKCIRQHLWTSFDGLFAIQRYIHFDRDIGTCSMFVGVEPKYYARDDDSCYLTDDCLKDAKELFNKHFPEKIKRDPNIYFEHIEFQI